MTVGSNNMPSQTDSVQNAQDTLWAKIIVVLRKNPPLVLTLLYVYATGVGMFYSWSFYRGFGINIFDYAEIGDFLLAALKNPSSLVAVAAGILGGLLIGRLLDSAQNLLERRVARVLVRRDTVATKGNGDNSRADEFLKSPTPSSKARSWQRPAPGDDITLWDILQKLSRIAVVLVLLITSITYAETNAAQQVITIQQGEKPLVTVSYRSFSGSAGQVTKPELELIGATQRAVFFYDVEDRDAIVIPQAQIVSIEVP